MFICPMGSFSLWILEINHWGLIMILPIFFGIGSKLRDRITPIKRLTYPTTYFIHCDLIDRNQNFFNNERSDLFAKLDVKGKPYEKVRYDASPQQPIRDCLTSSHVNSITLSVRDEDGELFDFRHATWIWIGNKLMYYLYDALSERFPVWTSRRFESVSSTAWLQNAKSQRDISCSEQRGRPLSSGCEKYKCARRLLTGVLPVLVFFQRHFEARVFAPLFLLLVFLPQFHSVV